MAQAFNELRRDNVREAIYEDVEQKFDTLRSNFSGDSFPENPFVGQFCFRTDESKMYHWNGEEWKEVGSGGAGKHVGEVFFTSRLGEIAGAVDADGSIYSVDAFEGEETIPELLKKGELPYVSMKEFEYITNFAAKTGEYVNGVVSDRTFNATAAGGYFKPISYPALGTKWSVVAMLTVDTTKGTADKPIISGLNSSDCKAPLLLHDASGNLYLYASSNGTSWNMAQRVNIGTVSNGETYSFTLSSYLKTVDGVETPYLRVILGTVVDGVIRRREQIWEGVGQVVTNNFPVFGCHSYANNPTNYWNAGTFHLRTFYLQGCEIWVDDEKIWFDPLFQDKPAQPCRAWGWDNGDTFRVPKVNDVYIMAGKAETVGEFISESLPNITGRFAGALMGSGLTIAEGAFKDSGSTGAQGQAYGANGFNPLFDFKASNSNSVYQDGAKVRPDSVRYRALVQVASSVKEDATQLKEYKFNNPNFFGQSTWTDIAPNNASWLLSNGAFHSGYTDYYNWLLKIYNKTETVDGVSVKGVSDEYTDYDFVINTEDTTFRLPLISGRVLVAKKEATTEDPSWFNWYSDGWLEQGGLNARGVITLLKTYKNIDYTVNATSTNHTGATGQDSDSGIVINNKTVSDFNAKIGSQYSGNSFVGWEAKGYAEVPTQSDYTELKGLYFYVGDTLQDASLINAGAVLTDVAELKGHAIVETYRNGTEWYRLYADGWCEQGGYVTGTGVGDKTAYLLKPYKDTDYTLTASLITSSGVALGKVSHIALVSKAKDSFVVYTDPAIGFNKSWRACGYVR